jgi:hypothetical protein
MAWAKNGTTTLGSAGDDLDIDTLTSTKFNMVLLHALDTGGTINVRPTFNNDSGSNYARRGSQDGGADGTDVNQSILTLTNKRTSDHFIIMYMVNIQSEEKLVIQFTNTQITTGAGTAPERVEHVAKWANTSVQISDIDINNTGTGDYAIDSNISVLGSD